MLCSAVRGGESPQSESISSSTETTEFARMARIAVQTEGRGRQIRLFVIAAVVVAALVWVGGLQLAGNGSGGTVVGTAPWKPVTVSDVSERATLIHQKIGEAIARLDGKAS